MKDRFSSVRTYITSLQFIEFVSAFGTGHWNKTGVIWLISRNNLTNCITTLVNTVRYSNLNTVFHKVTTTQSGNKWHKTFTTQTTNKIWTIHIWQSIVVQLRSTDIHTDNKKHSGKLKTSYITYKNASWSTRAECLTKTMNWKAGVVVRLNVK